MIASWWMNARRTSRDESEIAKETSLAFGERARMNNASAQERRCGLENYGWSAAALAGGEVSAMDHYGSCEILRNSLNCPGGRCVCEDCIREVLVKLANQTIGDGL
jgi:hypothetical protein